MNINIGKELNGEMFKQMLIYGAASLRKNIEIVNNLNVFPVPDGDTGTNMKMTFDSGLSALELNDNDEIGNVSEKFAKGMLLGARGNSGVILSQIFKGISLGLAGKKTVNALELGYAFEQGVKQSYLAVPKPVEGTILTVFREATSKVNQKITANSSIEDYLKYFINEGEKSLQRTPELLPILKEAGVIDSGGAGLMYIVKGMTGLDDASVDTYAPSAHTNTNVVKRINFNSDGELDYAYCTEFLLQLQPKKVDIETFDIQEIITKLEMMNGDSIVAIKDDDIVKVHVHTYYPGKVFEMAQQYGEFITLKVENMAIQHNETTITNDYEKPKEHKKVAVVMVAKGDGFSSLFKEMGADYIVDGGQSMNPSSDDFIKAFKTVNADNIIVFPNNGNILLAANQAKELYLDSNIYIVPTNTLGEGYSALAMYDPEMEIEEMIEIFIEQKSSAVTIDITKSIRDANINGINICTGDYIGLSGKKMLASNKDSLQTLQTSINEVLSEESKSIMTVFMGKDALPDDENEIKEFMKINHHNVEVYFMYTNQETYNYIIVLE